MSQPQAAPLAHLTDLSLDVTGSFVLYATDEYFAPKENLLKPGPPEWREAESTDPGKWMDGWESAPAGARPGTTSRSCASAPRAGSRR